MKSEDHSDLLRHRIHQKRTAALAFKKWGKPAAYCVLLLLSYVLGYASHSNPRISQQARDLVDHNTFSDSSQCSDPLPPGRARKTILDRVFNGTSPWDNFPPAHAKKLLFQEWKKGWGSEGAVFENLIRRVRPKTIVEVGTFLGASATHMAGLTRRLGLETQIICIDDFRGWPGYIDQKNSLKMVNGDVLLLYQFMKNVMNANATESIVFLPFSAGTALRGLCDWGVYGDLVEVDAAHDFHSAWADINLAYRVLRPDGVLFGHDYFNDEADYGVRRAVDLFARLNGFRVDIDGEHWDTTIEFMIDDMTGLR
ncbi:uncharacterized protein LOC127245714 [Andrographis paniculata]|uniref:uncharacterized protein LOC127245714 n=1 Tax=Andrographis paniculata TaxID=175694 RepID=UPI0021E91C56|nr:uncharacterized protein LOC127245714 [Andrographis paniculata]